MEEVLKSVLPTFSEEDIENYMKKLQGQVLKIWKLPLWLQHKT